MEFFQLFVEFVYAVYGSHPKFFVALRGNDRNRIFGLVVVNLSGIEVHALEVIVSACPHGSLLIAVDAADVFVGTDICITFLLRGEVLRMHVLLVDAIHTAHVSAYEDSARCGFTQGYVHVVLVLTVLVMTG